MKPFTIGQVAKQAGVGVETIRFYERKKLIAKPPRRPAGFREYPREVVERVLFIRHAKELGFSLREVAELLSLRVHPKRSCAAVERRATAKIAEIEDKIRSLQRICRSLKTLTKACADRQPTSDCPILESLSHE